MLYASPMVSPRRPRRRAQAAQSVAMSSRDARAEWSSIWQQAMEGEDRSIGPGASLAYSHSIPPTAWPSL